MEVVFDLTPTIREVSTAFFDNGKFFTIEEGEFKMLDETVTGGKRLSDKEFELIKSSMTDLMYAVVYYSVGNVFKSVDTESYRQPMYNFIDTHFVNDDSAIRKYIPRTILAKLLQSDTDSALSKLVIANSNTSVSECVGIFNDPIRALTNLLHEKLARVPAYQYLCIDFRLNRSCDILHLTLGEDLRAVLFRQLFPKGYYDGVELGPKGAAKHSNDQHVFDSYCLGDKPGD